MKEFLRQYLINEKGINPQYYIFGYDEDVNDDALTDAWLENNTSYIYKVGVLTAIDANKCDFIHIVIGTQRMLGWEFEVKGYFHFNRGENDDVAVTIKRAMGMLQYIHPIFEPR